MISILMLLSFMTLLVTVWQLSRHRFKPAPVSDLPPPTVSLLIPARNETHVVARALAAALAIDYPKLEIIVLDDQSKDNTSEKIRSFAQEGVRFISGRPLPPGWVGKNWACSQLAEAASGKYLLFCDIDIQLTSRAVNKLIRYMHTHDKPAVSVLPRLRFNSRLGAIFNPLLGWVLTVLNGISRLQPAYGGLMAFNAEAYRQHGGYTRYGNDILPELKLARDFAGRRGFTFFLAGNELPIYSHKKIERLNNSRLRYLGRLYRIDWQTGLVHLFLTVLPLAALFTSLIGYLALAAAYLLASRNTIDHWLLSALLLPLVCAWELLMLAASVFVRCLGNSRWKERQV